MVIRLDYYIKKWRILSYRSIYNKYFYFFLIYCIVISIIGFIVGKYDLNIDYIPRDNSSAFGAMLNSMYIRPFFEFLIYLYYFIYFSIFPRIFLRTDKHIRYFFKVFFIVFVISSLVGLLDLVYFYFYKTNLIYRHLYDGVEVGFRFHGFAGEPRDAFVYVTLGSAMYLLNRIYVNNIKSNYWMLFFTLCMLVMTKSMSGLIGVVLSLLLVIFFYTNSHNIHRVLFWVFFVFCIVFFVMYNTDRLVYYINELDILYDYLSNNSNQRLQYLGGQLPNIFPIWDRWVDLISGNPIFVFFGSGIGTSSVVNNIYFPYAEIANPHSQIVRFFYEIGLVGIYLFIYLFIKPIKRSYVSKEYYNLIIFSTLVVIGIFFGHRSSSIFIYYGVLIVVLGFKNK
jgi:hypothetical protein